MTRRSLPEDRETLEGIQLEGLRSLLSEVLDGNEFYRRKFAGLELEPGDVRSLTDLARLPFTTKDELQADQQEHPPFGTNRTRPLAEYTRLHQTSGTSGHPVAWLDTPRSWSWILECWQRLFEAGGIEASDRFFIPFGYGPFLGFWGAFEGAISAGHLTIPGGGMSTSARLRWIVEREVTVVACTPTYALRLSDAARESSIDLPGSAVRRIIVAGEPGGSLPEVRERLEEGWGARCLDHWGMTEVGPLGFEAIERPGGIHLFEDDCIAEIIDPDSGQPRAGDGRGELVLTTFRRADSPLIRYRTGDLVEARFPGAEGAGAPSLRTGGGFIRLEGGILGRADQMVLIRGNNVYPGAIEAVLRGLDGIAEYRAEVLGSDSARRLRLCLEPASGVDGDELRERVIHEVRNRLYFTPEVHLEAPDSLPRPEFKARRFEILPPD